MRFTRLSILCALSTAGSAVLAERGGSKDNAAHGIRSRNLGDVQIVLCDEKPKIECADKVFNEDCGYEIMTEDFIDSILDKSCDGGDDIVHSLDGNGGRKLLSSEALQALGLDTVGEDDHEHDGPPGEYSGITMVWCETEGNELFSVSLEQLLTTSQYFEDNKILTFGGPTTLSYKCYVVSNQGEIDTCEATLTFSPQADACVCLGNSDSCYPDCPGYDTCACSTYYDANLCECEGNSDPCYPGCPGYDTCACSFYYDANLCECEGNSDPCYPACPESDTCACSDYADDLVNACECYPSPCNCAPQTCACSTYANANPCECLDPCSAACNPGNCNPACPTSTPCSPSCPNGGECGLNCPTRIPCLCDCEVCPFTY